MSSALAIAGILARAGCVHCVDQLKSINDRVTDRLGESVRATVHIVKISITHRQGLRGMVRPGDKGRPSLGG